MGLRSPEIRTIALPGWSVMDRPVTTSYRPVPSVVRRCVDAYGAVSPAYIMCLKGS